MHGRLLQSDPVDLHLHYSYDNSATSEDSGSEGEPMPTPSSIPSESMGQFDRLVDWLSTSEKYLVWLQWLCAGGGRLFRVYRYRGNRPDLPLRPRCILFLDGVGGFTTARCLIEISICLWAPWNT